MHTLKANIRIQSGQVDSSSLGMLTPMVNLEPLTELWEVRTREDIWENIQKSPWPWENLNLEPSCSDMTPQLQWHDTTAVFPENLKRKLSSVITYLEQCQKGKDRAPPLKHRYKTATDFCNLFICFHCDCLQHIWTAHFNGPISIDPGTTAAITCSVQRFPQ